MVTNFEIPRDQDPVNYILEQVHGIQSPFNRNGNHVISKPFQGLGRQENHPVLIYCFDPSEYREVIEKGRPIEVELDLNDPFVRENFENCTLKPEEVMPLELLASLSEGIEENKLVAVYDPRKLMYISGTRLLTPRLEPENKRNHTFKDALIAVFTPES